MCRVSVTVAPTSVTVRPASVSTAGTTLPERNARPARQDILATPWPLIVSVSLDLGILIFITFSAILRLSRVSQL